jgi:hypothetical protein
MNDDKDAKLQEKVDQILADQGIDQADLKNPAKTKVRLAKEIEGDSNQNKQ